MAVAPPYTNVIEALRRHLNLSVVQAARLAGIVPATWSNVENGNDGAQMGTIVKIAETLRVSENVVFEAYKLARETANYPGPIYIQDQDLLSEKKGGGAGEVPSSPTGAGR